MASSGNTTYTCKHCGKKFIGWLSAKRLYCSGSCGASERVRKHGESRTRLYEIWCHMKTRCYCKTSLIFSYYGGRGIKVCDEWRNNYQAFRNWALANGYQETLEIDRIDTNGNYEPGNCRWATRVQQMTNTRKRANAKTSIFKGVSRHSQNPKWIAQIHSNKRTYNLGSFTSELAAALRYDDVAFERHGEFAHLNFPERIRIRQREKSESVELQTKGCQLLGATENGVEPGTESIGPGGSTFIGSA